LEEEEMQVGNLSLFDRFIYLVFFHEEVITAVRTGGFLAWDAMADDLLYGQYPSIFPLSSIFDDVISERARHGQYIPSSPAGRRIRR
jgi:hypothetical protein